MQKETKRYLTLQKRIKNSFKELQDIANQAREQGCEHIVEERTREWDNGYGRQKQVTYKYCPVCRRELHYDFNGIFQYASVPTYEDRD